MLQKYSTNREVFCHLKHFLLNDQRGCLHLTAETKSSVSSDKWSISVSKTRVFAARHFEIRKDPEADIVSFFSYGTPKTADMPCHLSLKGLAAYSLY